MIKHIKTQYLGVTVVPQDALEDGASVYTENHGLTIVVPSGVSPEELQKLVEVGLQARQQMIDSHEQAVRAMVAANKKH